MKLIHKVNITIFMAIVFGGLFFYASAFTRDLLVTHIALVKSLEELKSNGY